MELKERENLKKEIEETEKKLAKMKEELENDKIEFDVNIFVIEVRTKAFTDLGKSTRDAILHNENLIRDAVDNIIYECMEEEGAMYLHDFDLETKIERIE